MRTPDHNAKCVIYETKISDARWWAYDLPGNVGWIAYLVVLVQLFITHPVFTEIPMIRACMIIGILPGIAMVIGIIELISERILKLSRVLPKIRLFRGFGALTWGGLGGMIVGLNALFVGLCGGYSLEECKLLIQLALGGALCAVFAGLIFKTFHPQKQEEKAT